MPYYFIDINLLILSFEIIQRSYYSMNPYYPNQPGSFYQPNQQYPNPQQQHPQPQYPQAGPFYGQGQQQAQWRAPSQQGYYPNQQPQYYPNSQPQQQAWGSQGQNVPFYPQPGAGSPYAGSNLNWQGSQGVFPQHPFGSFTHVQQVSTPPPACLQNFPAVQPPGYPPTPQSYTAPSFAAPYPYTPLQNYTATPQYAAPVVPSHQNPPPAPTTSDSHIPKYTQFQPEIVSPVVVNTVSEEAKTIDHGIFHFKQAIDNNLPYRDLRTAIDAFKDLIKDECDNDEKKTEQCLSTIIESLYKQNGPQPERKVCHLVLSKNTNKLSMEHFIGYLEDEGLRSKQQADQQCLDRTILNFALHCDKANDIIKLANYIQDAEVHDDMIIRFITRKDIAADESSDPLIALLKTDTIDRYICLFDRVVANPDKYLAAHINHIAASWHLEDAHIQKLSKLKLSSKAPTDAAYKLIKFLLGKAVFKDKNSIIKANPIFAFALCKHENLNYLIKEGWDNEAFGIQDLIEYSPTYLKDNNYISYLAQNIFDSQRFKKLSSDQKRKAIQAFPFEPKDKDVQEKYLQAIQ